MKFKKFKKYPLIILTILCSMIIIAIFTPNSTENIRNNNSIMTMISKDQPKSSQEPFNLTQDFKASTYFISPNSSTDVNDWVYFSFMANKDGNYTLQIENYPSFLTDTASSEDYVSFDNPSGTDLWYIAYSERDELIPSRFYFKMLISEDKGKTWTKKLINNLTADSENLFDILFYVTSTAIAANPKSGLMIVPTWINRTDLVFFRSLDNGTTWSEPKTVFNSTFMGTKNLFSSGLEDYPRIDVAIMENNSILIVSEAEDEKYTDLVFIQSDDNGTTWYDPRNVTCSKTSTPARAIIPKIQVNRTSGEYYLMWRNYIPESGVGKNDTQRWAKFNFNQILSDNVQYNNVSKYDWTGSYDFYFDHYNKKFRFISIVNDYVNSKIEDWACSDFSTNIWTKTNFGTYNLEIPWSQKLYMNYVYSDEPNLFYTWHYLGNNDVYHYKVLQNYNFWIKRGFFAKDLLTQIFWNGRKQDNSPIETSLVKVIFTHNYSTNGKELFIIIDDENPLFKEFQQKRYYFNPMSFNITLTEIPWDILTSESCNAFLELFSEKRSASSWRQILENNWEDSNPYVFYSNNGILYVIYKTLEAGRKIIYLIKSYDKGITWSNPLKIYDSFVEEPEAFLGVAWGDFVFLYIEINHNNRYLYRSFDQGASFQDAINIYDPNVFPQPDTNHHYPAVSKLVISNNGTLFMSFQNATLRYYVIRSPDLGVNWTISKIFSGNVSMSASLDPTIGYDSINDLVYFAMPLSRFTLDQKRILNVSIAIFNLSTNIWTSLKSFNSIVDGVYTENFQFIISRNNITATATVRLIFKLDLDLSEGIVIHNEFFSRDLGENWIGPTYIDMEYFSSVCSNLDEIFYIRTDTDGNDDELFFKREGKLVRTMRETLSSSFTKTLTFNGLNDFGDYIEKGNYSYIIKLEDYAGNTFERNGWFYVDYNAPIITDFSTNLKYPLPLYDLTVIVNITDNINFTAYLNYKKDSGDWQKVPMNNVSINYFRATIPGDILTNRIEYFVSAIDLAGNEFILDNGGSYYSYSTPSFVWSSEGLFKENKEYSSSNTYTFTIAISEDLEYVNKVIFRYSYDEGDSWDDLELKQSSPEFEGKLDDIPGDLRELYYQIIIIDIYGNEYELTETQKIDFYPEVPSPEVNSLGIILLIIVSAAIGFSVAFGYIRLKKTSHEKMYQQLIVKEFVKRKGKDKIIADEKPVKNHIKDKPNGDLTASLEGLERYKFAAPFTKFYLGILCATVSLFFLGIIVALSEPAVGILILAGSLLLGVFGYMILMSRDITINVYLEKIYTRTVALESFQMVFLFVNIMMILLVGYTMDWFRYYLVESTFDIGSLSIPRLYLSVIAVFFSSLVLVIITTYIQLRKIVRNILKQRKQGATENMLLYLKDQNSSRMITHTGYKTIVFLVTVLLAIVSTTNLLTNETGRLLLILLIPFVIAGFSALIVHRLIERIQTKKEKEEMQMFFIDAKKICTKCGEPSYLSNKFCTFCGSQQIFADILGTYVARCPECNAYLTREAKFCPDCGRKIQVKSTKK